MRGKPVNELIIKNAKKLFTRHGFQKTSVVDIARALNLTKASLYNYFSSKEEIFKEAIKSEAKELFCRLRSMTKNIGSVEERLKISLVAHIKENPSFPLLTELFASSPQHPAAVTADLRHEVFQKEASWIEEIFKKGQREGRFNIKNPKLLAQALVAAIRGIEMSSELQNAQISLEEYMEEFARVLLKGITSNGIAQFEGKIS